MRRNEVTGLVLDPLDWPGKQNRAEDRANVAGIHWHLVAEAATDVRRDDPDHVLRKLRNDRHRGPDDVRCLGGHVDGQLGRRRVVVRDRSAALDG